MSEKLEINYKGGVENKRGENSPEDPRRSAESLDESDVAERLRQVIVARLNVTSDAVTPTANFTSDLGATNLDLVVLVGAFEEEFGFLMPDEIAEQLHTLKDAAAYITSQL